MRNKKVVILVAAVLFVLGFFLLRFKGDKSSNQSKSAVSTQDDKGKKILYYQSPMDPSYISEKPGKSPMGMDLVPVYEGAETPAGTVKIDPTTVQNIGVRTEKIEKRVLKREIRTVGRITYDERKVAYINTKIGGWIEKLYINYEGQHVNKDEPLYEIYSPALVATQEEYLLALEYYQKLKESKIKEISARSKTLLESAKKRLAYWDVSQEHINELKATGEVKKAMMIHSPISGVVIHKNVLEGQFVKPGENLYLIADLSRIWVYADIYEYELPWVKIGQKAEMTLSYLPGKKFRGTITYIYPYLESRTRTARVRFELDNSSKELKPDMYSNVKINTAPTDALLAIPKESVIHSGERNVIIIDRGQGLFEPRDVLTGMQTKDYYELLHGAKEGEMVVTSAQFLIDSESQLNEAINKMLKAKKLDESPAAMVMDKNKVMKMPPVFDAATQTAMNEIWGAYFYMRKQLSQDSLAQFSKKAETLKKNAGLILKTGNNQNVKAIAEQIEGSLEDITSKDIVKVREGFLKLSEAMINYMKHLDRERSQKSGYKLFYCGMEKKSWVQKEDEVGNPYLGSKIAFCGDNENY